MNSPSISVVVEGAVISAARLFVVLFVVVWAHVKDGEQMACRHNLIFAHLWCVFEQIRELDVVVLLHVRNLSNLGKLADSTILLEQPREWIRITVCRLGPHRVPPHEWMVLMMSPILVTLRKFTSGVSITHPSQEVQGVEYVKLSRIVYQL